MSYPVKIDGPRLLWTLACLGAATLPHLLHLPLWPVGLIALTITWRSLALRGRVPLPGITVRSLLALAGFAGVFVSFGTITGLDAGTALLVVTAALKVLETNAVRDLMVLLLISYFLIVTQFLFDQSILVAIYAVPVIWLVTTALSQVSSPAATMPWRRAVSRSGLLLIHALPIMMIAFVLFPRLNGPFWAIPRSGAGAITGLSDEMSPGSITRLLESSAVAFRVRFDDAVPPARLRYWRGPVLSNFDGRKWSLFQQNDRPIGVNQIKGTGDALGYEITLEPHRKNWLLALDQANPDKLPTNFNMTSDRRLFRKQPVTQLLQYRLESWPDYRADVTAPDWTRRRDLQFNTNQNKRTQAMMQRWKAEGSQPEIVNRALRLFREQEFVYSMTPPALRSANTVDEFLFSTRRGFCEHYASAFTLMMRAAGIPARVVLGYQGGETNPYSQHMTIRQSDAHAWSEVWLQDRGWVRVDPTGAVAPERVELGVADALPDGELLPGFFRAYTWLHQVQLGWDAVNSGWNQWVLGFDREKQLSALNALGMSNPDLRKMLLTMIGLVVIVLGCVAAHLVWQYRPTAVDPLTRIYRRFCHKLSRVVGERPDNEGPLDFARRVCAIEPGLTDRVMEITDLYLKTRYFPAPDDQDIARLKRAVHVLRV